MSRFFFNVRIADTLYDDPEGTELAHLSAARDHAIRIARGVISGDVLEGNLSLGSSVEVRDGTGQLLLALPFRDAIAIDSEDMPAPARFGGRNGNGSAYLRLVLPH